jgi:hypothetical protein
VSTLRTSHQFHTATPLPSGHVLVAGGDRDSLFPTVEVYDPVTGTWSTSAPLAVEHGLHKATLVDGTPPASPVVRTPGSGAWLNTSQPTFSGTAEPGSPVRLTLSGGPAWTLTADVRGDWSYTPDTALAEGPASVSAIALDEAGNEGPPSAALGFTVDTHVPDAPEVLAPSEGSAIYTTRKPDILGRAEPDSTVRLSLDGGEPVTLEADGVGFWRYTPSQPLTLGRHGLSATAMDRAGNTSAPGTATFVLSTPGSYYGWSCATSPALPPLWAWVLVAFWLVRPARGAGGPQRIGSTKPSSSGMPAYSGRTSAVTRTPRVPSPVGTTSPRTRPAGVAPPNRNTSAACEKSVDTSASPAPEGS